MTDASGCSPRANISRSSTLIPEYPRVSNPLYSVDSLFLLRIIRRQTRLTSHHSLTSSGCKRLRSNTAVYACLHLSVSYLQKLHRFRFTLTFPGWRSTVTTGAWTLDLWLKCFCGHHFSRSWLSPPSFKWSLDNRRELQEISVSTPSVSGRTPLNWQLTRLTKLRTADLPWSPSQVSSITQLSPTKTSSSSWLLETSSPTSPRSFNYFYNRAFVPLSCRFFTHFPTLQACLPTPES